jgi:hypothetical protein
MDDGGLSQARALWAEQAAMQERTAAAEAERRRAVRERVRPIFGEQNGRVKRAIAAFIASARQEGYPPERFYLGRPADPRPCGHKVFEWERYVGDGQSVRVSVVVWLDGRVSFGTHHGEDPVYGTEAAVLPFHLGGNPGWSPLSSEWWPDARLDDAANIVKTGDWFIERLAWALEENRKTK